MDEIGYQKFLVAIFKETYDEIVSDLRKAEREKRRAETAPTTDMASQNKRTYQLKMIHVKYLEDWIRDVMPAYLDIDPDKFIAWAHEEAKR